MDDALPPHPDLVIVRCFHDDGTGKRTARKGKPVYPARRLPDGTLEEMAWDDFWRARRELAAQGTRTRSDSGVPMSLRDLVLVLCPACL